MCSAAMKTGSFTLNPYAESYVPLSTRGSSDGNIGVKSPKKEFRGGYDGLSLPSGSPTAQYPQHFPEHNKMQGYPTHDFYGSSSHGQLEVTDKEALYMEFDMDMNYLQTTFPCISMGTLSDVFLANKGDLDTTVDMLNQLELYSNESPEKLPDSLEIGDVSESGPSSDVSSQKLKKVPDQNCNVASSSGLAPVS